MRLQFFFLCISSFYLSGCANKQPLLDDINQIKKDFISSIVEENVDESPFRLNYSLRTVFFSKEIISLFGDMNVYDHLPHGWECYEGKTFCKVNGKFKEITFDDLFTTPNQKEFLRSYCEDNLKHKNEQPTYFTGNEPLHTTLNEKSIHTFVIDERFLIIIFQPYSVGGCGDGPFIVKIPYDVLKEKWNPASSLARLLPTVLAAQSFTSSWDEEEFFRNLLER